MTDETKGDGMGAAFEKILTERRKAYTDSRICVPDHEMAYWEHGFEDGYLAAQSAMCVDEARLAEAVACVENHLSRMNRYYHEKVAWQVIKDHLAAIGGKE